MQSLNQIKSRLVNYLNSHAQIAQVIYGDNYKFAADRNLSFPVANAEWIESNMNGRLIGHTFRIIFADRTNPNVDGIDDDIDSDMLLIADDFFAWLQDQEGFILSRTSQIVKLSDQYGDRLSGIQFRIVLSTVRRANDCETPRKIPPPPPVEDALFTFDGTFNILALNIVPEAPATYTNDGIIHSFDGAYTQINITMPWLGEANFIDDYTLPVGLTIIDSFSYSGLFWNIEVSWTAAPNLTFNFVPIKTINKVIFLFNSQHDEGHLQLYPTPPANVFHNQIWSVGTDVVNLSFTIPIVQGITFELDYTFPLDIQIDSTSNDGILWTVFAHYTPDVLMTYDFIIVSPENSQILCDGLAGGIRGNEANIWEVGAPAIKVSNSIIDTNGGDGSGLGIIFYPITGVNGATFQDDYIIPDFMYFDSANNNGYFWYANFHYDASIERVYNFISRQIIADYTATFLLDGVLTSPLIVDPPAILGSDNIVHTSTLDMVTVSNIMLPLDVDGSHVFTDKFIIPDGLTINFAVALDMLFVWEVSCSYIPIVGNLTFDFISI